MHAIRRLLTVTEPQVHGLAELLIDCVDGGASVNFMHPLSPAKAADFWRRVAAAVANGGRALLVAEDAVGIVGTVHLILDQPENQPHRAELSKMLVHRRTRRRGLGAALLRAAETLGRDCGKSLLVLDNREQRCRAALREAGLATLRRDPRLRTAAAGRPLRHDLLLPHAASLRFRSASGYQSPLRQRSAPGSDRASG